MEIIICFTLILSFILVSISIEDLNTMLISEKKLIIFAISGIFYLLILVLSNEETNAISLIVSNFFSVVIIFIMMFSISYISYKVFGKNSLGMGDIKLSSFSTIWLGFELSYLSLCISFLLSAIYIICMEKLPKALCHFNSIHWRHFYQLRYFVHGL